MAHPHTTHIPRNPSTRRKRLLALFVLLATAGLAIGLIAAFNPDAFRASSKVGACHVYVCAPGRLPALEGQRAQYMQMDSN